MHASTVTCFSGGTNLTLLPCNHSMSPLRAARLKRKHLSMVGKHFGPLQHCHSLRPKREGGKGVQCPPHCPRCSKRVRRANTRPLIGRLPPPPVGCFFPFFISNNTTIDRIVCPFSSSLQVCSCQCAFAKYLYVGIRPVVADAVERNVRAPALDERTIMRPVPHQRGAQEATRF